MERGKPLARIPCDPLHCDRAKLWSELKLQIVIIYPVLFLAKSFFFFQLTSYKHFITLSPQAKEVFEKICPDEEFLQPVPNPEDIILDDFLQDANQNATHPGLGPQAGAVDPGEEEPPTLTTEQEQAEGGNGVSLQPGGEEDPTEQERAGEGCGVSNQPSGEESPVLAMEQKQTNGDGVESSQPSEEDSPSATAPSDS